MISSHPNTRYVWSGLFGSYLMLFIVHHSASLKTFEKLGKKSKLGNEKWKKITILDHESKFFLKKASLKNRQQNVNAQSAEKISTTMANKCQWVTSSLSASRCEETKSNLEKEKWRKNLNSNSGEQVFALKKYFSRIENKISILKVLKKKIKKAWPTIARR